MSSTYLRPVALGQWKLVAWGAESHCVSTAIMALLLSVVLEPPFSKPSGRRAECKMPEREIFWLYSKPTTGLFKSEALNPVFPGALQVIVSQLTLMF